MNLAMERSPDEELIDLDSTQIEFFTEKKSTVKNEKKKQDSSSFSMPNPLDFLPQFVPTNNNINVVNAGVVEEKMAENGRWIEEDDNRVQMKENEKKTIKKEEGICCDGPCGKMLFGVEMVQFGDCDHNICPNCVKTKSTFMLFDGTPGCCSSMCVKNAMEMEKSYKKNISNYSKSSYSFVNTYDPLEMVNINIFLFTTDDRDRTIRKKYEREVQPTTQLHQLKPTLKRIVPSLDCCDVFYGVGGVAKFGEMTRLVAFDRIKLSSLVSDSAELTLLIVAHGVPLNKLRLPTQ